MKVSIDLNYITNYPDEFGNNTQLIILENLLKRANNSYYNSDESIISDNVYDKLFDILKKRNPNSELINQIGNIVNSGHKIGLPIHMGSMNKLKTPESIKKWIDKNECLEYFVSEKLDGTSCGIQYSKDKLLLFTRGTGDTGRDISHLAKYLKIPKKTPENIDKLIVRGELIISKKNFNTFKNKTDARSMVNGLTIAKIGSSKEEELQVIDFIAYELVEPKNLDPYSQFKTLEKYGFQTAKYQKIGFKDLSKLNGIVEKTFIYKLLIDFKINSDYQIDGIIITKNENNYRNISGNPNYSFAFKINDEGKETIVKHVEWNPSKHAVLKPRVVIEEIIINNVKINHATAHHAKYILDNSIGPGSKLKVIRSGDVIPYIIEVLKPAESPQLPNLDYYWNETKVNIILKNPMDNEAHKYKKLLNFTKSLGIENISIMTIQKLVENGYNTIPKILNISKEQLLKLPGFKEKMSNKIYDNIHKIIDFPIDLATIMSASLIFGNGFGSKRLNSIINHYPNILNIEINTSMITNIPGFQEKTAKQFVNNYKDFKDFLETIPMIKIKTKSVQNIENLGELFKDQNIVMTGFTDKEIEKFIIDNGGLIKNTVNSKTNLLISKNNSSNSSKYIKALEEKVKIMSKEEFIKTYF